MEKLENEIKDMQKQIDYLYSVVIDLHIQNFKLLAKLKELEDFWYEE